MTRINAIDPKTATGPAKELLDAVQDKLGMVPNLFKTLAHSPAALQGYLSLSQSLESSSLSAGLREQIALTISETNQCEYCVAAHSTVGKIVGLNESELTDSRLAQSPDRKTDAILKFARLLVEKRGWAHDTELEQVRQAGASDAEIAEIVALVALLTFSNYFNHIAETEIDFPIAAPLVQS